MGQEVCDQVEVVPWVLKIQDCELGRKINGTGNAMGTSATVEAGRMN